MSDEVCAGCEEAPAVDSGLCRECADWCADFFTKLCSAPTANRRPHSLFQTEEGKP